MRLFARSVPRTVAAARLTAPTAVRRCQPLLSAASHLRPQQLQQLQALPLRAAFSTAGVFRAPKAEVDEELSAKLESEIQFENEVHENEAEPTSVRDFLDSGLFEIEDVPGREEVVLRRTYGEEKITVTFSVSDLTNYEPDMFDEDAALEDEDGEAFEGGRKGDASMAAAAEAGEELEGEDDGIDSAAVPVRLAIVVEKPGKGALNVEATAHDGVVVVDNLYYYPDAALAHESSAEAAHAAQAAYPGPAFGSLDDDLQVLVDRYLEERGISQALAVFAPQYLDAKEQREYLGFLKNVKTFVDA